MVSTQADEAALASSSGPSPRVAESAGDVDADGDSRAAHAKGGEERTARKLDASDSWVVASDTWVAPQSEAECRDAVLAAGLDAGGCDGKLFPGDVLSGIFFLETSFAGAHGSGRGCYSYLDRGCGFWSTSGDASNLKMDYDRYKVMTCKSGWIAPSTEADCKKAIEAAGMSFWQDLLGDDAFQDIRLGTVNLEGRVSIGAGCFTQDGNVGFRLAALRPRIWGTPPPLRKHWGTTTAPASLN